MAGNAAGGREHNMPEAPASDVDAVAPAAAVAIRTSATPGKLAAASHSAAAAVLHNEGLLLNIFSAFPDLADRLRLCLVSKAWLRALLQEITLPDSPAAVQSLPALVRLAGGALRTLDVSRPCARYNLPGFTEKTLLDALVGAPALTSLELWHDEMGHLFLSPDQVGQLASQCPGLQRGSSRLLILCPNVEAVSRLCGTLSALPGRHLVHLILTAGGPAQHRAPRLEALHAALEQAAGHPNLAGVSAYSADGPETARLLLPLLRAAPQAGRRSLTLFHVGLTVTGAEQSNAALFDALGNCQSVESVSVTSDVSRAPPTDLEALSSALRARAGGLRRLRLSDVACRALLQPGTPLASLAEASLPHLQSLSLGGCGLNRSALSGLAAALVAAPQLRRACLNYNPLFPSVNASFRAFARALSDHCPRLEVLTLEATLLGSKCAVLLASALGARRAPLRELRVSGNNIGAAGAAAFVSASRVEDLDACECGLQDDGVALAALALSTNRTLRQLNLSMNDCKQSGKGPERVFAELARNTTLTHLSWTNAVASTFGGPLPGFDEANDGDGEAENDDGVETIDWTDSDPQERWKEPVAEALSQLLEANSTLQQLHLSPGELCEGFVKTMSKGLALNTGLLTLELVDCRDADLQALGMALRRNATLRRLSIGTTVPETQGSWTDAGAVGFASVVGGSNESLRHLTFGEAPQFTRVGALALATILLGANEHLVLHLAKALVCATDDDGEPAADGMSVAFSALPKGLQQRVIGDAPPCYR